jgi:hypothetical protein
LLLPFQPKDGSRSAVGSNALLDGGIDLAKYAWLESGRLRVTGDKAAGASDQDEDEPRVKPTTSVRSVSADHQSAFFLVWAGLPNEISVNFHSVGRDQLFKTARANFLLALSNEVGTVEPCPQIRPSQVKHERWPGLSRKVLL